MIKFQSNYSFNQNCRVRGNNSIPLAYFIAQFCFPVYYVLSSLVSILRFYKVIGEYVCLYCCFSVEENEKKKSKKNRPWKKSTRPKKRIARKNWKQDKRRPNKNRCPQICVLDDVLEIVRTSREHPWEEFKHPNNLFF